MYTDAVVEIGCEHSVDAVTDYDPRNEVRKYKRHLHETGEFLLMYLCEKYSKAYRNNYSCNEEYYVVDKCIYEDINVGVAIISEHGLYVPVIKKANNMTVQDISEAVKDLAQKTRSRSLTMEDMQDATISMSNLGPTAVETGVAILTPPQGAILFAGNIRKVPMVNENDEIVVGRQIGFSMGYDHRFLDGMIGQAFDTAFKKEIEEVCKEALF